MALDGERRCRARKKRTEENHPRPKSRGDSVYADGFDAAHILAGGDEPLDHAIGNEQTGSAAHQRQDEDLREVLPKQAPTTATERRADRQFPSAGWAAPPGANRGNPKSGAKHRKRDSQ